MTVCNDQSIQDINPYVKISYESVLMHDIPELLGDPECLLKVLKGILKQSLQDKKPGQIFVSALYQKAPLRQLIVHIRDSRYDNEVSQSFSKREELPEFGYDSIKSIVTQNGGQISFGKNSCGTISTIIFTLQMDEALTEQNDEDYNNTEPPVNSNQIQLVKKDVSQR